MKGIWKKLIAVWIACCMLLVSPMASAAAAQSDTTEKPDWLQRYDEHSKGENAVFRYLGHVNYLHGRFAHHIEDLKNEHWEDKFVLWATHHLTGTQFDEEAYVDVLAEILAMLEMGMPDTAAIQAQYAERTALGKRIVDFTAVTVTELLSSEMIGDWSFGGEKNTFLQQLSDAVGLFKDSANLVITTGEKIQSAGEAAFLAHTCQLYQKKMIFLRAVAKNAQNKTLKKAAESLMQGTQMAFVGVLYNYKFEFVGSEMDLVGDLDAIYDLDLMSEFTERAASSVNQWLKKLGKNGLSDKVSKYAAEGLSKVASVWGLFSAGTAIGGAVGKFFNGDELERYREMIILSEIADSLEPAVTECISGEQLADDIKTKYNFVVRYVVYGEAFCYARLRGDSCYQIVFNSWKEKEGTSEEIRFLDESRKNLRQIYDSLAGIFPAPSANVVTVEAVTEKYQDEVSEILLTVPKITVADKMEATEKIKQSDWLHEQEAEMQSIKQMILDSDSYGSTSFHIEEAYNSGNLLSLVLCSRTHYPGSRGMLMTFPTASFNITTGEQVELEDLAVDENGVQELQNLMIEFLGAADEITLQGLYDSVEDTILGLKHNSYGRQEGVHWALTTEGLSVYFASGEIAQSMAGNIRINIPYERLKGVVKEEYLPAEEEQKEETPDLSVKLNDDKQYILSNEGSAAVDLFIKDVTNDYEYAEALLYYSSAMQQGETVVLPKEGISWKDGREFSSFVYEVYQGSQMLGRYEVS